MISNADLTVYHKVKDDTTRMEKWKKFNYIDIWWFENNSVVQAEGYKNSNNVDIRISYRDKLDIKNFSKGDVIVKGIIKKDIVSISELSEYDTYVITSIKNNNFGNNRHIHIQGH